MQVSLMAVPISDEQLDQEFVNGVSWGCTLYSVKSKVRLNVPTPFAQTSNWRNGLKVQDFHVAFTMMSAKRYCTVDRKAFVWKQLGIEYLNSFRLIDFFFFVKYGPLQ